MGLLRGLRLHFYLHHYEIIFKDEEGYIPIEVNLDIVPKLLENDRVYPNDELLKMVKFRNFCYGEYFTELGVNALEPYSWNFYGIRFIGPGITILKGSIDNGSNCFGFSYISSTKTGGSVVSRHYIGIAGLYYKIFSEYGACMWETLKP